ncbi:MAG: type II secretion system protein GspG [Thermodesulfovibrionales bacterium]
MLEFIKRRKYLRRKRSNIFSRYFEKTLFVITSDNKEDQLKIKSNKGFTLIEVIVVAGIIAVLAGILVPIIFKELDEAKITRAKADVRSIYTAVFIFRKDTGKWPALSADCTTPITLLEGSGDPPGNDIGLLLYDSSVARPFKDYLQQNNGCYTNWKGPYMADVTADPWGRKYYINAKNFPFSTESVWIISAGPNGILDTPAGSLTSVGDDIGLLIQVGIAPTM